MAKTKTPSQPPTAQDVLNVLNQKTFIDIRVRMAKVLLKDMIAQGKRSAPQDAAVQQAYERLAMLHTETMAELTETKLRMDRMSSMWWPLLKHWLAVKLHLPRGYR